jgi:NAD(P)-dependent dehydrogenase (short-subunit alcohol dehydrogenase family)
MRDEYDALFRSIIRAGVTGGAFKAVDPNVIGFAIIGALNWMPHWFSQSGPLSKDEIGAMFADYLVGGLLADGRPTARAGDRDGARLFDVEARVVVVTGAASGIGRAIAWGVARQGAHVVLVDREPAGLRQIAHAIGEGGGESETVEGDVTRSADVEQVRDRALKRFGQIDGLVHAAGVAGARPFLEMDEAEWNRVLEVNLTGSFRIAHAVAGAMAKRREGSIVLISSIAARTGGQKGLAHYAASKSGVEGLARALALELAPHGIRVNAIAPGITETPIIDGLLSDDRRELMRKVIPLGRLARPQDYVGTATFLLTPASGYLTGQVLTVDGGLRMG